MSNPQEDGVTYIGKCNFRGNERVFGVKKKDRRQHMYVIGKTGVGKSALLKNMALQDIRAGRGIGIVDPHGEFVQEVLEQIPASRINDVVYFDPVDADFPIGFNILEVPDVKYKHLVVSDLLGIFTKIWANVWSARMEYILQNCILALIDTPGTTLLGIPRILVDKEYRQKIVANVSDPVVRSFWTQEYETWRDQFRNEAIVPIQNKVGQFLNTGFVRNIVGQPTSSLNIPEIMNSGKILLVNVSKGKIGEDNSALLGAMIITKIQLAAMERVRIPEDERVDFYLYVDEFQNFATDSFAAILSEARKYRLNLFIAHQYVGQLVTDVSTKVRDAVFGNVGTMISFRVGATDAEFLEKEFEPEFMMQDLINLPNYHIYLKLMVDGVTSRAFSASTLPPLKYDTEPNISERIIAASRRQYSRNREEVEVQITEWSSGGGVQSIGQGSGQSGAPRAGQGGFRSEGQAKNPSSSGSQGFYNKSSGAGTGAVELFEAQCWNCGKTAQVPFKPDGKRPVYDQDCLKKIAEGKLIPLPERMPSPARARYGSSLGDLGIEFESGKQMVKQTPRVEAYAGARGDNRDMGSRSGVSDMKQQRPPENRNFSADRPFLQRDHSVHDTSNQLAQKDSVMSRPHDADVNREERILPEKMQEEKKNLSERIVNIQKEQKPNERVQASVSSLPRGSAVEAVRQHARNYNGGESVKTSGGSVVPASPRRVEAREPFKGISSRSQSDSSLRQAPRQDRPIMKSSEKESISGRDQGSPRNMPGFFENQSPQPDDAPSGGFHSDLVVRSSPGTAKISLHSLKSSEREVLTPAGVIKKEIRERPVLSPERKEANASDLRDILKQVLDETAKKNNIAVKQEQVPDVLPLKDSLDESMNQTSVPISQPDTHQKEDVPAAEQLIINEQKESIHDKSSSAKILKPGDAIKF